jgi:alkanesulfonate monooxygenase SsuD/methylene tetrahydromethanopterin reductase-like flavin-dependent oxidoreductase (luciferase family)
MLLTSHALYGRPRLAAGEDSVVAVARWEDRLMARDLKFGWLSPVIGNRWSDHKPIVVHQDTEILPVALPHFDSLWVADHFYGFDAKTDPFLEAWTTLTWLAARHPGVTLCHHVLGHGYRPPALTAKMAATLQVLSEGRFVLGIGAGWRQDEYTAYGYEFPRPAVRFAQLEEVIHICRLMWTEAEPSFEGRYFSITGASAPPLPDPPPRICVGAGGEQIGLPLVGRLADMWNGPMRGTDDDWRRRLGIVRSSAERAGRDPASIEVSVTLERALPESDAASEQLVTELAHCADLGVQHFVMDFGNPLATEPILRFVEQVMRPLRA